MAEGNDIAEQQRYVCRCLDRLATSEEAGHILLCDSKTEELVVIVEKRKGQPASLWSTESETLRYPQDQGVSGQAMRERRCIVVNDLEQPEWKRIFIPRWPQARSEMTIPLADDAGAIYGALNLEHESPNHFTCEQAEAIRGDLTADPRFKQALQNLGEKHYRMVQDGLWYELLDRTFTEAERLHAIQREDVLWQETLRSFLILLPRVRCVSMMHYGKKQEEETLYRQWLAERCEDGEIRVSAMHGSVPATKALT